VSLQYDYLPEGIHQFKFHKPNRHSVDEYLKILQQVLPALHPDEPWLSILDMSIAGLIPVRYALTKIFSFSKPYLDVHVNRTLVLHNAGTIGQVMQSLVNPINNNLLFLPPDKRAEGIKWLLEQEIISA